MNDRRPRLAIRRRTAKPAYATGSPDWASLRAHAVRRGHEALDEVPAVLRRLKTFLLVGSVTMVAFAAALVAVLWHAVR